MLDRGETQAIGLVGVLIRAKQLGAIPCVASLTDRLINETLFWNSAQLRQRTLDGAGEA